MKNEILKPTKVFDFKGLKCPLPVLKTKRALKEVEQGEIIEIYKNARAFDKTNIKSKEKVKYVLEMKSGVQNFKIGNKLKCNF